MNTAINKKAVAQSFSRAATHYDDVALLQRQIGEQLLAALPKQPLLQTALDIGCGTGHLTRLLKQHAAHVTALDFAPGMLAFAREHHADVVDAFVCADADELPFQPNSFDLVFSNFVLQWCASLPTVMRNLFQQMTPGSLLSFSIPGENTLWELKQSWRQADPSHVHVNQFAARKSIELAVAEAGFVDIDCRHYHETLYYPSPRALTAELKTLGAHNVNEGRSTHLTGKRKVAAFVEAYETLRTAQGLPASWDIVCVAARKPAT